MGCRYNIRSVYSWKQSRGQSMEMCIQRVKHMQIKPVNVCQMLPMPLDFPLLIAPSLTFIEADKGCIK